MRTPWLLLILVPACGAAATPRPVSVPQAMTAPSSERLSAAAVREVPLAFGQSFRIHSSVLGEDRVINVYLPPDYASGGKRYPVLYALDGGMREDFLHVVGTVDVSVRNEVIVPLIVIGIENTERRRDLVSATSVDEERRSAPHAGGADRFRRFLREELKPEVARRYSVSGEAAIVGESFAGLFVLETLLEQPDLFEGYVAIDPSVWWNHSALVRSAPEKLATWRGTRKRLFVATADYRETQEGVEALLMALKERKPVEVIAVHEAYPSERHGTVFPVAEAHAYRMVFPAPAHR